MRLRGVELHDGVLDFVVLEALEARHLRETVNGLLEAVDRFRDTVMGNGDEHQPEDETGSGVNFLLPGVRRFQAYSSVVETPRNVDITLDGEIRSHTPVVIQAEVGPLSIFLPDASPVRARQRLNS
jgi:diacylglycerol kinase family enzyme